MLIDDRLFKDDRIVGSMRFNSWRASSFVLFGQSYRIRQPKRRHWDLHRQERRIARCARDNPTPELSLTIQAEAETWRIVTRQRGWRVVHEMRRAGRTVGLITPRPGWWDNRLQVNVEEPVRIEILAFAVWLIGIHSVAISGEWIAGRADLQM